jgi:hypothetical protein
MGRAVTWWAVSMESVFLFFFFSSVFISIFVLFSLSSFFFPRFFFFLLSSVFFFPFGVCSGVAAVARRWCGRAVVVVVVVGDAGAAAARCGVPGATS